MDHFWKYRLGSSAHTPLGANTCMQHSPPLTASHSLRWAVICWPGHTSCRVLYTSPTGCSIRGLGDSPKTSCFELWMSPKSLSLKPTDITCMHCIVICRTHCWSRGKVDITLKTSSKTSNELRAGDWSAAGLAYSKNKLLNTTKAVINILHIRPAKRQLSDEEEQY